VSYLGTRSVVPRHRASQDRRAAGDVAGVEVGEKTRKVTATERELDNEIPE
jgi:hypothetical protein